MTKPIQPYRFIDPPDTRPLIEIVHPGTDKPNIYGPVIFNYGEFRVRAKDDVFAVYLGAKLEATVKV